MAAERKLRSPWGQIQTTRPYEEGLKFVSTASHGGFKLDAKHNRRVPKAIRMQGGWYEEDCEAAFVIYAFPGLFSAGDYINAIASIKYWYPDRWAQLIGE
jgi:hypothetical protein